MSRTITLALAALMLGGCSFLFDPGDLMDGKLDAGPRPDSGGADARATDAPGVDASGIDAGGGGCADVCELAAAATPSWNTCSVRIGGPLAPTDPAGADFDGTGTASISLTLDGAAAVASVGFVNADMRPFIYEFDLGTGLRGSADLSVVPWTGGDRAPTGVRDIAVRHVTPSQLAFVLVGASATPESGIWVGSTDGVNGTIDNLSAGGDSRQDGPLGIGGNPPRFYWNELMPTRLIGSLPVDALAPMNFRLLFDRLPDTATGFAVAGSGLVVAESEVANELLLWNGLGPNNVGTGVPDAICIAGRDAVQPAIASVAPGSEEHVVAWVEGVNVHLRRVSCSLGGSTTDCCADESAMISVPEIVTGIALREMPEAGFVLAAHTAAGVHLGLLDGNLVEVMAPAFVPSPSPADGFGIAVLDGPATEIHIGVVQVALSPPSMQVTDVTVCP